MINTISELLKLDVEVKMSSREYLWKAPQLQDASAYVIVMSTSGGRKVSEEEQSNGGYRC